MKILKKMLCGVMAAVMMVTALCIPASAADDYEKAKLVDSGKKVSFTTKYNEYTNDGKGWGTGIPNIYKVQLSKAGTLKLTVVSQTGSIFVQVLDKDATEYIDYDKMESITGIAQHHHDGYAWVHCDSNLKKSKTVLEYKLKKGTYFVSVLGSSNCEINGKTSISFSYPQAEKKSDAAEITSFEISLKKGDSLQLGAILSGDGDVKWSTSKKSVATVSSKGKITAKAKGSAVITAKVGNSSRKITVKVS